MDDKADDFNWENIISCIYISLISVEYKCEYFGCKLILSVCAAILFSVHNELKKAVNTL